MGIGFSCLIKVFTAIPQAIHEVCLLEERAVLDDLDGSLGGSSAEHMAEPRVDSGQG